jgi:hypothetical protein
VKRYGCPVKLRRDCGTENDIMAAMQCEFRSSGDAHFYGTSPANQRIESWWSYLEKNVLRNLFNPDNDLEKECAWFCFSDVIQNDLDFVKEQWNTHRIRNSKHDTIPGIPDELFYVPEKNGGAENLSLPISVDQIQFVQENLLEFYKDENIMQEYFRYIFENSGSEQPRNWEESEQLYFTLIAKANGR